MLMLADGPATLMLADGPVPLVPNNKVTSTPIGQATRTPQTQQQDVATRAHSAGRLLLQEAFKVTQDWQLKADEIEAAYGDFFNHISFRRGWKVPPFKPQEARQAFQTAARVVATGTRTQR